MPIAEASIVAQVGDGQDSIQWTDSLAGLVVGALGGALGAAHLTSSLAHSILLGALFGLIFGFFFGHRASTPGAGLIWGLSCSLLLWILIPAGISPLLAGRAHSIAMLSDARSHFGQLVAYLVVLGMPVGLTFGLRAAFRTRKEKRDFRWGRAIVVGGLAGTVSGLVFGRWMYEGEFYPLLAGVARLSSRSEMVAFHFLVACAPVKPARCSECKSHTNVS